MPLLLAGPACDSDHPGRPPDGVDCLDLGRLPSLVGSYPTPYAVDVLVADTLAYVVDLTRGLQILSVAEPAAPRLLGSFAPPSGQPSGIARNGSVLALLTENHRILLIDISDPAVPRRVQEIAIDGHVSRLVAEGNRLYVAVTDDGTHVFDWSDPGAILPVPITVIPGEVSDIAVVNGVVYLARGLSGVAIAEPGPGVDYRITAEAPIPTAVSIARVGSRLLIGGFQDPGAPGLWILDILDGMLRVTGLIALPDYPWAIAAEGDEAYLTMSGIGLQAVDLSNPARPVLSGRLWPARVGRTMVHDSRLFVPATNRGLLMIDRASPPSAQIVGRLDVPLHSADIEMSGTLALIAGGTAGLHLVSLVDPAHPRPIGRIDAHDSIRDVTVDGSFAYVADTRAGVGVIDVSDPHRPMEIGRFATMDPALGVAASNGVVCVATGDNGPPIILDVRDPTKPRVAATFYRQDYYRTLANVLIVPSGVAYFWGDALLAVDINDPEHPVEIGLTEFGPDRYLGWVADLEFAPPFLVGIDQSYGIFLVDAGERGSLRPIGRADLDSRPIALTVADQTAYVSTQGGTVQVFDLSDAVAPQRVWFLSPPGSGGGIGTARNYLVLTRGDEGLMVFPTPCGP